MFATDHVHMTVITQITVTDLTYKQIKYFVHRDTDSRMTYPYWLAEHSTVYPVLSNGTSSFTNPKHLNRRILLQDQDVNYIHDLHFINTRNTSNLKFIVFPKNIRGYIGFLFFKHLANI